MGGTQSSMPLTRHASTVTINTMKARKPSKSMSELLREAIAEADSIRGVAKAAGLTHVSLIKFLRHETSLRLDLADKLAAHFEIVSTRKTR